MPATPRTEHIGIVGAGIIGLAVARELASSRPGAVVTVLEKEDRVGAHQTGHNSGVVHAGVYYPPGSLKARLCREGMTLLREYCAEHALPYHELGKVVVATHTGELDALDRLEQRATENGVPGLARLDAGGLREVEPHAAGVAALHSPRTAVVDYPAVARRLAEDVRASGGEVLLGQRVRGIRERSGEVVVATDHEHVAFDVLVVCAGLTGDALAAAAGRPGDLRIVPFRGEYHRLRPQARHLVRGLVYPVPDPRYPFLGIHLTRGVDGEVLVGPNAVMALAREGYTWRDVDLGELSEVLRWPGTRRLARQHWRTGVAEVRGSLSRRAFLAAARRYVPELRAADLERGRSGVRAQGVDRRGGLVDDFAIDASDRVVLVRNAPSPGATSSLAIARHVAGRVPRR